MTETDHNGLGKRIGAFFSPTGALSRRLEGYEPRPSQARMALACLEALTVGGILLAEAGTGTGKTLAYLVPALAAGKRIVVSTGTRNLQEQLFFKDIPFLQGLGGKFEAAVMKGRGNYLCLRKLKLFRGQPLLRGLDEVDQFKAIERWAADTETGDFAELKEMAEGTPLFGPLSCRGDNCVGRRCPHYDECWLVKMRARAAGADVVIVNHHLLFADLAVRDTGFGAVIPDYDRAILDEAHELEDVATSYFGVEVSNWRFDELGRDAAHEFADEKITDERLLNDVAEVGKAAQKLFKRIKPPDDRFRIEAILSDALLDANAELAERLSSLEAGIGGIRDRPESLFKLARRSAELRDSMAMLLEGSDPSYVFWGERRGRGVFLRASPVDVSPYLRGYLFDNLETAVLTSATLAVGGNFDFLRSRLGIDSAEELVLPSHFDFKRLTRLYVPNDLPDPNDAGFLEAAAEEMVRILELTKGRAFLLFTSLRNMERAHGLLEGRVPFPLLLQGTSSRRELIEQFRQKEGSVLLASASFWQGVDVRGPDLSCVVVDKLPFAVPDDPIVGSRIARIKADGGDPFWQYQVPSAALALKQGLGRLVRSSSDRGIMAVLDSRLLRRRYGRLILGSLHGSPMVTQFEELKHWWK